MIANEKQYKIIKAEVRRFEEALSSFNEQERVNAGIDLLIVKAQKKAIESQIQTFNREITEYELLKAGETKRTEVTSFNDLPSLLIKARIAQKLTQYDLAQRLGLKEQQIQRYEAEQYATASLKRLVEIANVLSIKFEGDAELSEATDNIDWKKFPIIEMYNRGWLGQIQGSVKNIKENAQEILTEFFYDRARFSESTLCLHRKSVRSGSKVSHHALQAWQAQILIQAQKKRDEWSKKGKTIKEFRKREITSDWINELVQLSVNPENIPTVESHLADKGIILVVEPHLQGTFLDGAAMLLARDYPVIGMTLRYDRLDNFWFVLMHELGHVMLHLSTEEDVIFDDCDADSKIRENEEREAEADQFALNSLIPEAAWRKSPARFSMSKEAVEKQAGQWKIHPSIIAGRLRKETKNWVMLNELVGRGEVRKFFQQEFPES